MNNHVDHLIVGYLEGQLSQVLSARVRKHVTECVRCRMLLDSHERLVSDLHYALTNFAEIQEFQKSRMWGSIIIKASSSQGEGTQHVKLSVLPLLLAIVSLFILFTFEFGESPLTRDEPIHVTEILVQSDVHISLSNNIGEGTAYLAPISTPDPVLRIVPTVGAMAVLTP